MQLNNFNPAEKFWELVLAFVFGEVLMREIQHVQFNDNQKAELTAEIQIFFDNLDEDDQKLFCVLFGLEFPGVPHEATLEDMSLIEFREGYNVESATKSIEDDIKNSDFAQNLRRTIYPAQS